MTYLGLDLGTSGLRALLVSDEGTTLATAERAYTASHPHPGWSEQDPADWIVALDAVMAELCATCVGFGALRGIGVAGHMHGATLLDAQGRVIRPCILWNDTRSHAEARSLDALPEMRALSGNIVFPGFTAPKLDWLRSNEPEAYSRVAKVLLPAAFLNFHLTGRHIGDMSDASGTSWLDVGARRWSPRLLDLGHMRRDQMPDLVEGSAPAGELRDELVQRWGLSGSVIVAGGAGDNAAAACGAGILEEGQGFVSLGTSGVLLCARNGYTPAPETAVHTFCHAAPGRWYQMGVMLAATDSLNWLARICGSRPAELGHEVGGPLRPPGRIRFLPYLSGERTPHNDADIRGSFTGLGTDTTRTDMTRAVMEGVAYGLRDSAQALKASGATFASLLALGGGASSAYWLKLIATVLNTPLHLPAKGEFGAALGAARLAQIAATGAPVETIVHAPEIAKVIEPDINLAPEFDASYVRFAAAYPATKAIQ